MQQFNIKELLRTYRECENELRCTNPVENSLKLAFAFVYYRVSNVSGVKEVGVGLHNKNVSKPENFNINPTKGSGISLEIQPSGHVILGKKGVTLSCIAGLNQNISWLHNGVPAPPCGIARCTLLRNGSLHLHKVLED